MNTLIIGYGEIGQALSQVLNSVHMVKIHDPEAGYTCDGPMDYAVMNVCIPFSDSFEAVVHNYQERFQPKHTVIHSTVPIGTSERCGALHSPCVGLHPDLAISLVTFTKFIGGPTASRVADFFRAAGMRVYLTDKSQTTEALKLMSTDFYAVLIEYTKEVKKTFDALGLPFEMWTLWTDSYNQGYERLGHPEYHRPNLVPIMEDLGGHCLRPNLSLMVNDFTLLVLRRQAWPA